jgi:hypothetical protein
MPFYTKNDLFAKTGSGQTQGKHSKRDAFLQGERIPFGRSATCAGSVRIRFCVCPLLI